MHFIAAVAFVAMVWVCVVVHACLPACVCACVRVCVRACAFVQRFRRGGQEQRRAAND